MVKIFERFRLRSHKLSPLYPTFKKRIDDAAESLISRQVTPWSFLKSGTPFRIKKFDGGEITYQEVEFDGSPRLVFWARYIEPFLEELSISEIAAAICMAEKRHVDAKKLLTEVQGLLSAAFRRVYARMAEIDRRLRGKGFPNKAASISTESKVQAMDAFLDERIRAEVAMWRPESRVKLWLDRHPILRWVTTFILGRIKL